jgi:hypothetical protein
LSAGAEKHKEKNVYFYPLSSKNAAVKIPKNEVNL